MDEQEQKLFDQFEKDTNHQFLLKLTERMAKFSWLLMTVALVLIFLKFKATGYPLLVYSLVILFTSLMIGIYAERVRRRIQQQVDGEIGH